MITINQGLKLLENNFADGNLAVDDQSTFVKWGQVSSIYFGIFLFDYFTGIPGEWLFCIFYSIYFPYRSKLFKAINYKLLGSMSVGPFSVVLLLFFTINNFNLHYYDAFLNLKLIHFNSYFFLSFFCHSISSLFSITNFLSHFYIEYFTLYFPSYVCQLIGMFFHLSP